MKKVFDEVCSKLKSYFKFKITTYLGLELSNMKYEILTQKDSNNHTP